MGKESTALTAVAAAAVASALAAFLVPRFGPTALDVKEDAITADVRVPSATALAATASLFITDLLTSHALSLKLEVAELEDEEEDDDDDDDDDNDEDDDDDEGSIPILSLLPCCTHATKKNQITKQIDVLLFSAEFIESSIADKLYVGIPDELLLHSLKMTRCLGRDVVLLVPWGSNQPTAYHAERRWGVCF